MDSRRVKASAEHLRRFMNNLVVAHALGREYLPPQIAVYHVTYACNANCAWCSRRQDQGKAPGFVSWSRIEQIFQSLRRVTPALYLTGGEPLLEPRLEEMLILARGMGFYPIVVNTNAVQLKERSLVPELADITVASLHSVNTDRLARVLGIKQSLAKKAIENVSISAKVAKRRGNTLVVNCVVGPNNASDAHEVLSFCLKHGLPMVLTPAIQNHEPIIKWSEPVARSAYSSIIDRMMLFERHAPVCVGSTFSYLKLIRYFEPFDCRPSSILSISPDGYVLNPCELKYPHLPKRLAWLDGNGSLLDLLPRLLGDDRKFRPCLKNCFKACYAEPALALEHPFQAMAKHLHF